MVLVFVFGFTIFYICPASFGCVFRIVPDFVKLGRLHEVKNATGGRATRPVPE